MQYSRLKIAIGETQTDFRLMPNILLADIILLLTFLQKGEKMHASLPKLFLIINYVMLFTLSVAAAPMIKVDSADFYIGIIKEGEQKSIKHTFIVKNTGDAVLKIEKVKPG
jgi:hypothetical protein